jgi:hypothetical protein
MYMQKTSIRSVRILQLLKSHDLALHTSTAALGLKSCGRDQILQQAQLLAVKFVRIGDSH